MDGARVIWQRVRIHHRKINDEQKQKLLSMRIWWKEGNWCNAALFSYLHIYLYDYIEHMMLLALENLINPTTVYK